jgi:hypothetical protein
VSLAGIESEFFWLEFLPFDDIFFQNGENQGMFFGFSSCQISKKTKE